MAFNAYDPNSWGGQQQQGQQSQGQGSSYGQQQQTQQGPKQQGSGRFTNLSNYLQANQGAGSRMASGISGRLESQNQQQKQKEESSAGSVREGINQAKGQIEQGQQWSQQLQQNQFDPTQIASDQAKVQQFQNLSKGSAFDANQLTGQMGDVVAQNQQRQQALQQRQQQIGSEQGRFGLLKERFGQNVPYGLGQQRLDQLFLQNTPGSVGAMQSVINSNLAQAASAGKQLGSEYGSIIDPATGLVSQSQNIANQLSSGLTAQEQNLSNELMDKLQKTKSEAEQQTEAMRQGFLAGGGEQSDAFVNALISSGIDPNQSLYGLSRQDLSGLLSSNQNIGISDVATQQDLSRRNALATLAGIDPNSIIGMDSSKIGKYSGPTNIDINRFNQLRQQAQEAGQSSLGGVGVDGAKQAELSQRNRLMQNLFTDDELSSIRSGKMTEDQALANKFSAEQFVGGKVPTMQDFLTSATYRPMLNVYARDVGSYDQARNAAIAKQAQYGALQQQFNQNTLSNMLGSRK